MTTIVHPRPTEMRWQTAAWGPVVALPVVVAVVSADWPAWVRMWGLAIAIYAGFKWLTFVESGAARRATFWKGAGYLFLWTGMDAKAFFGGFPPGRVRGSGFREGTASEFVWAIAQTGFGVWLLLGVAPGVLPSQPLVAGWLAMIGVVSILHFGLSHLLSLGWRATGVSARHIMHKPLLATSLADFWGRRWNLAFRDLMHRFVLRPLAPSVGAGGAMIAVFLVSGLIHDAVISLAAGGGWGLPTLYFLIQGVAVLVERSRLGKRVGLGRGVIGWMFAAVVIVGPVGLLFHQPFVMRVVVPMVEAVSHCWLTNGGPALANASLSHPTATMNMARLIFVGGVLQFGILVGSACVPAVLNWRKELAKLEPLSRQLVWVHGAFIVLVIVGFGMLSVLLPGELAGGTLLARGICGFIAVFWAARLLVQFFVFDAKAYLRNAFLRIGYNALTVVFVYLAVVYGVGAVR